MTLKHLNLLLLAVIAIVAVAAQNEDSLQIPVENDNKYPPVNHAETIEGSGDEMPEDLESKTDTSTLLPPPLENIESRGLDPVGETSTKEESICPKLCVCHTEGADNDFVIDCSGYDLTEFPSPLNEKATVLNIQNNKLTEIPKEVSALKNLKILNANNNSIANLALGSISELPALVTLKLRNNRLVEYPKDLKNSIGLVKLEELDLGDNDMRTELTLDTFSKFVSLRTITLPSVNPDLQQDLCNVISGLEKVQCTGSCEDLECQDDTGNEEDIPVLPQTVIFTEENDNADPSVNIPEDDITAKESTTEKLLDESTTSATQMKNDTNVATQNTELSLRSKISNEPTDSAPRNALSAELPKEASSNTDATVQVGATKSDTTTGGVDKSIIGLVVAGMVVVVAAIVIKKNWSSIKKRFGSNTNSRTPDRPGGNANGTTPEEVPLQDNKSPV